MSGPTEEVSEFTYLGNVVSKTGETEEDVKLKLGRARVAFRMTDKVWTSNVYSRRTKLRLFNSNVKQLLLYGCKPVSLMIKNSRLIWMVWTCSTKR